MAIRRQGEQWQVEFQQAGERIFRRLPPGATRGQAVALEAKLRRDIFDSVSLGKVAEPLLSEAIAAWLQNVVPHHKDNKKPGQLAVLLAPFVRQRPLKEVAEVARECTATWSGAGNSNTGAIKMSASSHALTPATINRRLAVLKAASKYAYKQGWIAENLSGRISLLPEHNKREVYLTPTQVRMLATSSPSEKVRSAIMIAAYTGLRASELLALKDAHLHADSLTVAVSKTGKPRIVPIAGLLRPYLSALPLGLSYDQLRQQFLVAREAAGMPHVRWHDLRHTCASMLINAGVDLYVVGRVLGHEAAQTTQRYAHLSDETLQKAMRKLR